MRSPRKKGSFTLNVTMPSISKVTECNNASKVTGMCNITLQKYAGILKNSAIEPWIISSWWIKVLFRGNFHCANRITPRHCGRHINSNIILTHQPQHINHVHNKNTISLLWLFDLEGRHGAVYKFIITALSWHHGEIYQPTLVCFY